MIRVLPENNTQEGAGVDCEHLAIELETDPVRLTNSITYCHIFTCVACRLTARVIEHKAVIAP